MSNYPMVYGLDEGVTCPICELGKGLRKMHPIDLGLTGWENYEMLHCDICGVTYVGKGGEWKRIDVRAVGSDD